MPARIPFGPRPPTPADPSAACGAAYDACTLLPSRPRRAWYAALAAVLALAGIGVEAAAAAPGGEPVVRLVRLDADIDPVSARYAVDQLRAAERQGAAA